MYISTLYNYEILEIPITIPSLIECTLIKLIGNFQKPILVAIIYIPPDKVSDNVFEFFEELFSLIRSQKQEFIITGDFNINFLSESSNARKLLSLTKEQNISQIIKTPTRIATRKHKDGSKTTSTLIDHLYVSCKTKFSKGDTIPFTCTDHNMVYVLLSPSPKKCPPRQIEYRNFKNFNVEEFEKEISTINWSFFETSNVAEKNSIIFESVILGVLNKHAPLTKRYIKGKKAPWYTPELRKLTKERDRLFVKAAIDTTFYEEARKCKNKVNNAIRSSQNQYIKKKLSTVKSSADAWKVIDELIQYKAKLNPKIVKLIGDDGKDIEDEEKICEKLANEFTFKPV